MCPSYSAVGRFLADRIAPDAFPLQGVFNMDVICGALLQSLDAEGVEQATLIGISAGGGVAQVLLQAHPEHVKHAVFSHCGVLKHDDEAEREAKQILWLVRLLPMVVIRRVLRRMTPGEIPASSRWIAFHEAYMEEALPNAMRGSDSAPPLQARQLLPLWLISLRHRLPAHPSSTTAATGSGSVPTTEAAPTGQETLLQPLDHPIGLFLA